MFILFDKKTESLINNKEMCQCMTKNCRCIVVRNFYLKLYLKYIEVDSASFKK